MRGRSLKSVAASRPSIRFGILAVSAMLVAGLAFAVSSTVSENLSRAAVNEATRNTEAVVHGFVDPLIGQPADNNIENVLRYKQAQIDTELEQLVGSGKLLRIKIWSAEGKVVYSDLPELRGRQFPVADDLENAMDGKSSAEF